MINTNFRKDEKEKLDIFNKNKEPQRAKVSFNLGGYGQVEEVSDSNTDEISFSSIPNKDLVKDKQEKPPIHEVKNISTEEKESGKKILLQRISKDPGTQNVQDEDKKQSKVLPTTQSGQKVISDSDSDGSEDSDSKVLPREVEKFIEEKIEKIFRPTTYGNKIPKLIQYPDASFEQQYEQYLGHLNDDQIEMSLGKLFLPASTSNINGSVFQFTGGRLQDFDEGEAILEDTLHSLAKYKFKVPDRLKKFSSSGKQLTFDRLLSLYPSYFLQLGRAGVVSEILKPPSQFQKLEVLGKRRVTESLIKQVLSHIPEGLKSDEYIHELIPLFYFKNVIDDNPIIMRNKEPMEEIMLKATTILQENEDKNKEELNTMFKDPGKYFKKILPTATVLDPERMISTLNEEQEFVKIPAKIFASANRTSFSFGGPDKLVGFILGNILQTPLPDDLEEIAEENYCGKGGLWMVGERYNKSWAIYQESNRKEYIQKKKDYYKLNFLKFLKDFGYVYSGPKMATIPSPEEYISATTSAGETLYPINNKSKGTFSQFKRRNLTAYNEIKAGLSHFLQLTDDPRSDHFIFFYQCYKFISAKFKDEIHSYKKPPRFYNPTMIAGFIPFQLVFNKVFSECPPLSQKCPKSLLGITDTGETFSKLMSKIAFEGDQRYHYSDNFWIKEKQWYVSVDVQRCDSNLSKEALFCPLAALGDMVFSNELSAKFKILARLFVETIPRRAYFSILQGKKYVNLSMPFYWLPSGVVGTPYFNHLFTGFFLYYTKDTKWLTTNGDLSEELLEKANIFGIHLEIASKIDFTKLEINSFYPFDLLGRSGYWDGKHFIPVLERSRVLKALTFMKKNKYDHNGSIANFVRIAKMNSLIDLGALLYNDIAPSILTVLTVCLAIVRGIHFSLTFSQANQLLKDLDELSIDPLAFERFIFKGFIPSVVQYKINKTGDKSYLGEKNEFDQVLSAKLKDFPLIWAALMPVISGQALATKSYSDAQKTTRPYFVAPLIIKVLRIGLPEKIPVTLHRIKKLLVGVSNANFGGAILKDLLSNLFIVATSENSRITDKIIRDGASKLANFLVNKKRYSKEKVKVGVQNLLNAIQKDPELSNVIIKQESPDDLLPSVLTKDKSLKLLPHLLQQLDYEKLLSSDNKEFWNYVRLNRKLPYINYIVSQPLFRGVSVTDSIKDKTCAIELPEISAYRTLEMPPFNYNILNPEFLQYYNDKMLIEDIQPILSDLGTMTGYLSVYYYNKSI